MQGDSPLARLQRAMESASVDLVVVAAPPDLRHLVGYAPLSIDRLVLLLVGRTAVRFVVPEMELEPAGNAAGREATVVWPDRDGPAEAVRAAVGALGLPPAPAVAVDDAVPYASLAVVEPLLGPASVSSASALLAPLRLVKSDHELEKIAAASELVSSAVATILAENLVGMTEADIAGELSRLLWRGGAGVDAHILVGTGPRSALHHQRPEPVPVRDGDVVLIDVSTELNGYWADITATAVQGSPTDEFVRLYDLVATAQETGVAACRPGVTAGEVDRLCLAVLRDAGLGEWASGRTGHGIGRDVHEPPSLVEGNDLVLERGMVATVEPGVYLPGKFGIRIEDTVVVDDPPRRLTRVPPLRT